MLEGRPVQMMTLREGDTEFICEVFLCDWKGYGTGSGVLDVSIVGDAAKHHFLDLSVEASPVCFDTITIETYASQKADVRVTLRETFSRCELLNISGHNIKFTFEHVKVEGPEDSAGVGAGQLLEAAIYGIWLDGNMQSWLIDRNGVVFHTPFRCVAQAQFVSIGMFSGAGLNVAIIGEDGLPVFLEAKAETETHG